MSNDLVVCVDVKENLIVRLNRDLLVGLLKDRSTGKNIIWATSDYADLGEGYQENDEITIDAITGDNGEIIKPRSVKSKEEQAQRVRNMAEVFTPLWICNKQNNLVDSEWFGRENVFNEEVDNGWIPSVGKVQFPDYEQHAPKGWESYIGSKRLEITCGEAPYLVSRYDTVTGEEIPVSRRIGLLDRKFRVINERVRNFKDHERTKHRWLELAMKAVRSTYGFEWSGDNLLLARENVLYTVIEYYKDKFDEDIAVENLLPFVEVISWNIWQMDGIKCVIPNSCHDYVKERKAFSPSMFDTRAFSDKTLKRSVGFCDVNEDEFMKCQGCLKEDVFLHNGVYCKIKNWSTGKILFFKDLMNNQGSDDEVGNKKDFKFDVAIGNPPYHKKTENNNRAVPVYNLFMDATYNVANIVTMITPARFLFNAGQTPKNWNKKILSDEHFKIVFYEEDCTKVFPTADIKGGVAVSIRSKNEIYGAIDVFTKSSHLNNILKKVKQDTINKNIVKICVGAVPYHYTEYLKTDHPEYVPLTGDSFDLRTNALDKLGGKIFFEDNPKDDKYIRIFGLYNKKRKYMWVKDKYVTKAPNFGGFKVFISKANGAGKFGEVFSELVIGEREVGHTQSFISIGNFDTKDEAKALVKYIKSKFCRSLLSILKTTPDLTPYKWKYVPLQNFTSSSDIDWSKSVAEIDQQLYKKYGLSSEEIAFIEKNVKEMV